MKVLVIEDERFIRENIIEILQFNGIEACGAGDGNSGLALAHNVRPDLIICDVMMEGMDGFEVLNILRDDEEMAHIPLIFVTGLANHQFIKQARQAGAREYLVKPFTQDELLTIIRRYATSV